MVSGFSWYILKFEAPFWIDILLLVDISDNIEECVLFGFAGTCNGILTPNFCILYAKYYIYIQKLFNSNKIGFLNFLTYLKQKINQ